MFGALERGLIDAGQGQEIMVGTCGLARMCGCGWRGRRWSTR